MPGFSFASILFLCMANSTRARMAEGLARGVFGPSVRILGSATGSVGLAAEMHPLAARAMAEVEGTLGLVGNLIGALDKGDPDLVVVLGEQLPPPSATPLLHWSVADPEALAASKASEEEKLQAFRTVRDNLLSRLAVLHALREIPAGPNPVEFHLSIRTPDLAASARFYSWLLDTTPKEWTHRYVTFISAKLKTNFVLLVDDGMTLHQDTMYHLGVDVGSKSAVVDTHRKAVVAGWHMHKPARTTWRGTPLHELWLKDPGGNLVEVYARLTGEEMQEMPADKDPTFLVEEEPRL
jgi:protein-tyrosine-phosphatase/catechol 2,3-dioxygenase-like lactoylglutathione lyase family enzyme